MRTTQADKEAVKASIIKKAIEIFSTKGFHSTNMQDIADELGFSKGPIYYHFKNKYELYKTITDYCINNEKSKLKKIFDTEDPIWVKINNDLIFNKEQLNTSKLRYFINIASDPQLASVKQQYDDYAKWIYQLKLYSVNQAIENGEIKKDSDANIITYLIMTFFCGISQIVEEDMINIDESDIEIMTSKFVEGLKRTYENS
ncbi:TetR/AcrR family transcriptional regulator [Ilyobacter sp.]|uniref:TetR/AcrR family transcriptional regulator n=1 Tax=Ilyobacter sp. TaxID=3100343 RepID=UPI0035649F4F